jgi:hypothetical protein
MQLDNTPLSVVSVEPPNGALSVPTNTTVIKVTFSEPAEPSSVNGGTVILQQGIFGLNTNLSLSSDGRVATLTPFGRLSENTIYRVVAVNVTDRNGLRMASEFNSTFTTADETAPTVSTIVPANNSGEFPLDGTIAVTFNEPIDPNSSFAGIISIAPLNSPQTPLTGNYTLDATGQIVSFTPSGGFAKAHATPSPLTVNAT